MANMAQCLENLYSDLESILVGMTPSAKSEILFARRTPEDEELRGTEMLPGRPRLFQIREDMLSVTRYYYTGAQYSGIEVVVPIDILYPMHDTGDSASWHAAAIGDHVALNHLLLDSSTITSTGVEARTAWDAPEIINIKDDPWFIMRVRVTALLHVAQS